MHNYETMDLAVGENTNKNITQTLAKIRVLFNEKRGLIPIFIPQNTQKSVKIYWHTLVWLLEDGIPKITLVCLVASNTNTNSNSSNNTNYDNENSNASNRTCNETCNPSSFRYVLIDDLLAEIDKSRQKQWNVWNIVSLQACNKSEEMNILPMRRKKNIYTKMFNLVQILSEDVRTGNCVIGDEALQKLSSCIQETSPCSLHKNITKNNNNTLMNIPCLYDCSDFTTQDVCFSTRMKVVTNITNISGCQYTAQLKEYKLTSMHPGVIARPSKIIAIDSPSPLPLSSPVFVPPANFNDDATSTHNPLFSKHDTGMEIIGVKRVQVTYGYNEDANFYRSNDDGDYEDDTPEKVDIKKNYKPQLYRSTYISHNHSFGPLCTRTQNIFSRDASNGNLTLLYAEEHVMRKQGFELQ